MAGPPTPLARMPKLAIGYSECIKVQSDPWPAGRKNHLIAGSIGVAERWAMVSSLIATEMLNGIEPHTYRRDAAAA